MLPVVLLSALVASAAAASNYTFPSGFDLNQVNPTTRASWCVAERNSCPKICGGVANANSCDPQTLDFTCTCSNGTDADVSPYEQTVPYFVCQENYAQCIQRSTSLNDEDKCKDDRKECGSLNATEGSSSSSSTTMSTTSLPTSTGSSASSNGRSTATSTSTGAAGTTTTNAAVRMAQEHAMGLVATVFFVALSLSL